MNQPFQPAPARLPAWALAAVLLAPAAPPAGAQPAAGPAPAPAPAPAPMPSPATPAPQQVEITGTTAPESNDERRRSTASRITFGREELDRMGDSTLGEVLKRLPGVTLGGPPGRGGQVRMRGMGGGYTQILIDGQRMAPGFSLDSISPEQIERIEIMRAPVAEFGTRAIAGTINVVMRSDFKRKANELRFGGGADGPQGQVGGSWTANGQAGALGYNLSASAFQGGQAGETDSRTLGLDEHGAVALDQREQGRSEGRRRGLFANARLQWRLGPGNALDLQPFLNLVRTRSDAESTLVQATPATAPYLRTRSHTDSTWQMARLNGTWLTGLGDGGRLQLRFGGTLSDSSSLTERLETGGSAGAGRTRSDDSGQRELSIETSGKFSQLLAERHSASLGWELQHSSRDDRRVTTVNGQVTDSGFGETIQARVQRVALFAQDEWDWSPSLSFYAGARWEAIETTSDSAADTVRNRSAVFTPLAHLVWKLPDAPRDQLRLSLTRSYRSPNTSQLIGRLTPPRQIGSDGQTGNLTDPYRGGNPTLKPELAWGLELGLEHYLDAGGILSANVYLRRIDDLIRNVIAEETVPGQTLPQAVSRPQNVGQADAAGLELEAKARLADLWPQAPAALGTLSLRGNFSLMWSRVDQVPGPDNRLEGQPPWTANLGADWPVRGWPVTLGASLNFTPRFVVQQIDAQTYRQGRKSVLDAYALWRLNPDASLRLSISNAGARDYDTGSTVRQDGRSEARDSTARTYTTVNLRAELRF